MSDSFHRDEVDEAFEPASTLRQQQGLRRRAERTGRSFGEVKTVGGASRAIEELDRAEVLSEGDLEREARIAEEVAQELGCATDFRDDEFEGRGSSARWA